MIESIESVAIIKSGSVYAEADKLEDIQLIEHAKDINATNTLIDGFICIETPPLTYLIS
jgi:hypothetical protein